MFEGVGPLERVKILRNQPKMAPLSPANALRTIPDTRINLNLKFSLFVPSKMSPGFHDIFEHTCAYAWWAHSVCLSVCLQLDQNSGWTKIPRSKFRLVRVYSHPL